MSALGQKQTFAPQIVMFALHPKADIDRQFWNFRFGPIEEIRKKGNVQRSVGFPGYEKNEQIPNLLFEQRA
jgi:hypothetical protein